MKEWKRGGKERIGNNIIGEQVEISFPSVKNRSLFIRVDLSGRMRRGVEIEAIVDDGGRFVKKKKKSCEGILFVHRELVICHRAATCKCAFVEKPREPPLPRVLEKKRKGKERKERAFQGRGGD